MLRILKILHPITFFLSRSLLYSFCATSITIKWNICKPNFDSLRNILLPVWKHKRAFCLHLILRFRFPRTLPWYKTKVFVAFVCTKKENGHHFYTWSILYFMFYIFYEEGYNNSCRQWQQTKGKKLISLCPKYNIDECAEIIV